MPDDGALAQSRLVQHDTPTKWGKCPVTQVGDQSPGRHFRADCRHGRVFNAEMRKHLGKDAGNVVIFAPQGVPVL